MSDSSHSKKETPPLALVIAPPAILAATYPVFGLQAATLASALSFEFVNGFHDASNAIAPLVKSGTLSYRSALLWSVGCTLAPAPLIGVIGAGVAHTIGTELFQANILQQNPELMFCGITAAMGWGLLTWRIGLPSSASHALLGGLAGAAIANALNHAQPLSDLFIPEGWLKVSAFLIGTPIVAGGIAHGSSFLANKILKSQAISTESEKPMDDMPVDKSWSESLKDLFQAIVTPKKLPMLAATGFLNFGHSLNDAQKAMPIVAWSLSSDPTAITQNVQMLCYGAMTLGTLSGGRRIVDKLVHGVSSKHDPRVGLVAAAVSSLALTFANISHAPVSTSQTMGAATIGANAGLHHQHMNWKTATDMATAWAVTPVATGAIAAGLYELSKIIPHAPK